MLVTFNKSGREKEFSSYTNELTLIFLMANPMRFLILLPELTFIVMAVSSVPGTLRTSQHSWVYAFW